MIKKFFTLEPGEEFLGVIRPSLWVLAPRVLASLALICFPFIFWKSLLGIGIFFGGPLGIAALVVGTIALRDVSRHYLENGVYVTNRRAIDVHARRSSFRVTELVWSSVDELSAPRKGVVGMLGYGSVHIRGNADVGFSLVVAPVWRPHLVIEALPRV